MGKVSLESLSKDNAALRADIGTLTNHMLTLANRVYKHDEGMYPEEYGHEGMPEGDYPDKAYKDHDMNDMPYNDDMGGMGGEMPMDPGMPMDPAMGANGGMPGMPEDVYPDEDKMGRHGYARSKQGWIRAKGYAGNHETAANEEGGKWDVKDDNVKGNEPQPAGDQGGDREDETFGVGGMAYSKLMKRLDDLEENAGVTIAKAQIPGNQVDKANIMGEGAQAITREMQMQAVKSTWKELGKFAVETGYLSASPLG